MRSVLMGAFPHIRHAAKSDIGRKRTNNEDAFGAFPSSGIFCVADGMGGGDDGEVASAAIIEAVERFTKECPITGKSTYPIEGIVSGVCNAVDSASSLIAQRTRQKGLKGCGSTFVGICFDAARPNTAIALHAGDSRLYRIRGRSIKQMTVDHSAAELIGAKNDSEVNPMFRGMILRAVGIQPSVELERTEVQLKVRDRILICSDGLSRMVDDRKMLSIIRADADLEAAVDRLVAAANDAGGVDNITAVLIEVGEFPPPVLALPFAPPAGVDTAPETQEESADVPETCSTAIGDDSSWMTEDNDSIPPTAEDGGVEGAGENSRLDEPAAEREPDTEDDPPANVPAPVPDAAAIDWKSSFAIKTRALFSRAMPLKRFVAAGLIFASIFACCVCVCIYSHFAGEAEDGKAAEATRKAELERNAREAFKRRVQEEKAAREKAEADALREREAKAREAARQAELRKAEELRLRRECEEAEARAARAEAERKEKERLAREQAVRLELERKAAEEKKWKAEEEKRRKTAEAREWARKEAEKRAMEEAARKEKERHEAKEKERLRMEAERKALEEKRRAEAEKTNAEEQAISAFAAVVKDGAAAEFHSKIEDFITVKDSIPSGFRLKLSQAANAELPRAERIAAIVESTKDVQRISRAMMEYSANMRGDIEIDLADEASGNQKKAACARLRDGCVAFEREAKDFIGRDAASAGAQMKCIGIIRSIPKWFDLSGI